MCSNRERHSHGIIATRARAFAVASAGHHDDPVARVSVDCPCGGKTNEIDSAPGRCHCIGNRAARSKALQYGTKRRSTNPGGIQSSVTAQSSLDSRLDSEDTVVSNASMRTAALVLVTFLAMGSFPESARADLAPSCRCDIGASTSGRGAAAACAVIGFSMLVLGRKRTRKT